MGRKERTEIYFRKRLKRERDSRGWSQAEIAKLLSDNGIPMHSTTIAKIEAGDRAVRIEEATGIADLLDVSLDGLLGRKGMEDDQSHAMSVLADEARKIGIEAGDMMERLRRAYADLEAHFDFAGFDEHMVKRRAWSFDGMSLEHQRAMMMWTGRDMAIHHLYQVVVGLYSVVAFRSMSPRDLAEHLEHIEETLAEHADEWRAMAGVETNGRIELKRKGEEPNDAGEA
jgi:transcriptional regulator with XRE-family HTH domain